VTDMTWQSNFETGIERIDREHRVLLELIKSCHDSIVPGCELARICRTVDEVASYARFHFLREEHFMLEVAFPDLERHRTLHAELFRQLDQERSELEGSATRLGQFVFFLYDWFVSHTVQEDRKIARHLEVRGGAQTGVRRIDRSGEGG
jgi:hemerythrin-like metal-binding protein